MIGRVGERDRLLRLLDLDAEDPLPRLVLVTGRMGYGKTALVTSVLADSTPAALSARGDRFASSPLTTARPVIETIFDADLEDVVTRHSPASIVRRVRADMQAMPRALVLDDAQWTDPASERFFTDLIASTPSLVTVLAYRPEMEPTPLIEAARAAGAWIEQIDVGPLDDTAIAQLANELDHHQQRLVTEASAGNPLFARTLVAAFRRHPEATGLDEALHLRPESSSDPLLSAVGADIRALEPRARRTLTALAVLDGMHPDAIGQLTDSTRVDEDLRTLRKRGLLTDNPSEPLHPVVRHSAYRGADGTELAELHRKATALPGTDALQRAEHLSRLGPYCVPDDLASLLDAAASALDTDPATVERWLLDTRHLPDRRRDLLYARAQVLRGRTDRAGELLTGLLDDPQHGPEARILYAHALRMSGQPAEAHDILSAGDAPRGPELLVELAASRVMVDAHRSDDPLLDELVGDHPEPYGSAAAALRTIGLLGTGEIDAARREFAHVATTMLGAPAEHLRDILDAVICTGWCAYMLDDFRLAVELAERGLRIARRFGRATAQPGLNTVLAYAGIQLGRLDEADAAAELAVETAERFRVPDIVAMARNALLLSAFWQQDTDLMAARLATLRETPLPAVTWWRRTVESTVARTSAMLGEPIPHVLVTEPADAMTPLRYADSATIAMFTGEPETAIRLLEEGRELAQRYRLHSQATFLGMLLAGMVAGSDPNRAIDLLEEARPVYDRLSMPCHLQLATTQLADIRSKAANAAAALLTRRELEVAQHVARGLTNQQIADELFLSRRTVEEHVSNVLGKLGLKSRHAIASAITGS